MIFKVVDTNVYIRDLSLVMAIRDNCVLAVPWTVIQVYTSIERRHVDCLSLDLFMY